MSEIVEFSFNNKAIACIVVNGDPWFKAKDVATILAYANTTKEIIDNVDDDDKRKLVDLMGDCPPAWSITTKMQSTSTSQVCIVFYCAAKCQRQKSSCGGSAPRYCPLSGNTADTRRQLQP